MDGTNELRKDVHLHHENTPELEGGCFVNGVDYRLEKMILNPADSAPKDGSKFYVALRDGFGPFIFPDPVRWDHHRLAFVNARTGHTIERPIIKWSLEPWSQQHRR